jgi:hypothetical protein
MVAEHFCLPRVFVRYAEQMYADAERFPAIDKPVVSFSDCRE